MDSSITEVEKSLDKIQEFVFKLRKFFRKNPEIKEKFIASLNEKEDLIF